MTTKRPKGKCQLCDKPTIQCFMDGPVSWLCKSCQKIVERWTKAKDAKHRLWKRVNHADLTELRKFIESKMADDTTRYYMLFILDELEEMKCHCSEIERMLYNAALELEAEGKVVKLTFRKKK